MLCAVRDQHVPCCLISPSQAQAASCFYAPAIGEAHLDRYPDRRPVAPPTVADHIDDLRYAHESIECRAGLILLCNAEEINPTILVNVTMTADNS